jgi:hypothetical protein
VFVSGGLFKLKAARLPQPRVELLKDASLRYDLALLTSLEKPTSIKHSSIFGPYVSSEENKVL